MPWRSFLITTLARFSKDTAVGASVLELFRDLARRESKGLLIVTHDPKVRQIADRVVGIRDGRLAA
jgi:putative ABC transport system ATP-binding protein